ncbi:MAG: hypothetical protein K2O89_00940 [Clostridia bacterium]|nr:hypothetical protein [Clostridia bacterium]
MKAQRIRYFYGVCLSVFTAVLGALFISVAVGILSDGDWAQGAYSRDLVAERLFPVSIVFYIWIAAVIAGFVLSLVYPVQEKPVKIPQEGVTLRRLNARIPEGSGEEYFNGLYKVHSEQCKRLKVYGLCAAICFACAVASAIYLLQPANFKGVSANEAMLKMMLWVLPCVIIGLISCVWLTSYQKNSQQNEITAIKRLISSFKGNPVIKVDIKPNAAVAAVKKFFSNKYTLLGIRLLVAVVAVTFIVLGVFNGGARDVFIKAINICTECIGLG